MALELPHEILGPQELAYHFNFILVVALLAQFVLDQVHELECLMIQHRLHALSLLGLQVLDDNEGLALRVPAVGDDFWQVDEHHDFIP